MKLRSWSFVALGAAAVVAVLATPARSDAPSYYAFADQRTLAGVPNFMNVISNAPWAAIGMAGLLFAWRRRVGADGPLTEAWERLGSLVLFAGVLSVAFGSAWFHYRPEVGTLVWDRLPMSVIFMSTFALVIGDRMGLRGGRILLWPLVGFGVFSVLYWRYAGDFRGYILAQFFPLVAIPLMLACRPARYTEARLFWLALGWYGLAKAFELLDGAVFAWTGVVSGHTLKHLAAAVTTLMLLRFLQLRRQVQ